MNAFLNSPLETFIRPRIEGYVIRSHPAPVKKKKKKKERKNKGNRINFAADSYDFLKLSRMKKATFQTPLNLTSTLT